MFAIKPVAQATTGETNDDKIVFLKNLSENEKILELPGLPDFDIR